MRKYQPLRDKVIIKVLTEETTASGLVLVSKEMEKEEGEVLSVGKACFYDTDGEDLQPGDKVVFPRYSGKVLERSHGVEIRTMRDIDLLCKVEE